MGEDKRRELMLRNRERYMSTKQGKTYEDEVQESINERINELSDQKNNTVNQSVEQEEDIKNNELEALRKRVQELEASKEETKNKKKTKRIVDKKKERRRKALVIIGMIIAMIILLLVKSCGSKETTPTELEKEKNQTVATKQYTPDIDYTDIPVFSDARVNSDARYMTLWNPKDNQSLLKYYIGFVDEGSEDYIGSGEDTVDYFYESKYVDPGTAFSVEIYPELEDGANKIRIKTMICNPETGKLLNGNIQDIVLYRE